MPRLNIKLVGHLIVGGGQSTAGVDAATIQRWQDGDRIPYIPATAIRGAIRIQLESLLRALRGSATGPYPRDEVEDDAFKPEDDAVSRLFGYSGRTGERANSKHGQLRFTDALPINPAAAAQSLAIRAGVEIDDKSGAAEDQKLFFREVVELSPDPVQFQCWLETGEACSDDLKLLRAAVETTSSLGGSQSSGGGEIEIKWLDSDPPGSTKVGGEISTATRARLTMTLLEPAHFGDGGPFGNHHGTRSHIPGSTVRGAVAWALLRNKVCGDDDPAFKSMFLGARPVSFGDGLPLDGGHSDPTLRPVTFRKPRAPGSPGVDVLKQELARGRVNEQFGAGGLYLSANWGRIRPDPEPARKTDRILRRTRTRVSIDRQLGSATDEKLFSIEQIEPWQAPDPSTGKTPRTTFVSRIENLTPETAQLLSKLEGHRLLVGAGRNHGMGLVETALRFESDPDGDPPVDRVLDLVASLNRELETLATQLQLDPSGLIWSKDVPVVLMAVSDFIPTTAVQHPLAEFESVSGKPFRRFLRTGAIGGYDQHAERQAARSPLKDLVASVGAGSLYVYAVAKGAVDDLLLRSVPRIRRGVGGEVRNGCGRFVFYGEP